MQHQIKHPHCGAAVGISWNTSPCCKNNNQCCSNQTATESSTKTPSPHTLPVPEDLMACLLAPASTNVPSESPGGSTEDTNRRSGPAANGPGRCSKFEPYEYIVLLRGLYAVKAHISSVGETRLCVEIAALNVNATKNLMKILTWKALQDRYKKLHTKVR